MFETQERNSRLESSSEVWLWKLVKRVMAGIFGFVLLFMSFRVFETLNANEVMVIQSVGGDLNWHTTPSNFYWQGLGKVTHYPKRAMYEFKIPIRFNDGGHGTVEGSVQYEYPLDVKNLTNLHTQFNSPEAIQKQLIETVVNKSVYLTGPLMSSKESYAEKRNDLIRYMEDQIENGVYQTITKQVEVPDPYNENTKRQITVVEIAKDPKTGQIMRQETGVLHSFGLKPFNFSLKNLPYDIDVEAQIKSQQQLTMAVQTSIAEAKKAEQRALTAQKNGEADAAEAKWKQEVIKATMVTQAEQQRDVAKLEKEAAEFKKQALILEGQGEGEKRKLIMAADGALAQKLEAYKYGVHEMAVAIATYKGDWVPTVVNGGGTAQNGASQFIDLLTTKAALDLGLSLKSGKQKE